MTGGTTPLILRD